MSPILSRTDQKIVETLIKGVLLSASTDIVLDSLWEQARDSYFCRKYIASVLVSGACAEAALRFYCDDVGVSKSKLRMSLVDLIRYSVRAKIIPPEVGRALNIVRLNYRNPWVHIDLDKITQSGTGDSIEALVLTQSHALDCLWLTAITISTLYGSQPVLIDRSLRNFAECLLD